MAATLYEFFREQHVLEMIAAYNDACFKVLLLKRKIKRLEAVNAPVVAEVDIETITH